MKKICIPINVELEIAAHNKEAAQVELQVRNLVTHGTIPDAFSEALSETLGDKGTVHFTVGSHRHAPAELLTPRTRLHDTLGDLEGRLNEMKHDIRDPLGRYEGDKEQLGYNVRAMMVAIRRDMAKVERLATLLIDRCGVDPEEK